MIKSGEQLNYEVELILNENLSGYTLMYRAVHGTDDVIPSQD